MCGRFTQMMSWSDMVELYRITSDVPAPNLRPRHNVAPTQVVPVVRLGPERRHEIAMMRRGLIPTWAKDMTIGAKLINARAETLAEKPSFRTAFKKRRCLVPADGFYEWTDILQMNLGSKHQGRQLGSCRQYAARRGQCAGTMSVELAARAADGFVSRPQGAPFPLFILPAGPARVKPELARPEVERSAAGCR